MRKDQDPVSLSGTGLRGQPAREPPGIVPMRGSGQRQYAQRPPLVTGPEQEKEMPAASIPENWLLAASDAIRTSLLPKAPPRPGGGHGAGGRVIEILAPGRLLEPLCVPIPPPRWQPHKDAGDKTERQPRGLRAACQAACTAQGPVPTPVRGPVHPGLQLITL